MSDIGTEEPLDLLARSVRVLDDVMEESRDDGHRIHVHSCEDLGDRERMDEVWLTREAALAMMRLAAENVKSGKLCRCTFFQ